MSDPNGNIFIADRIVDKRMVNGNTEYYVKWKGWNNNYNTWEPYENIIDGSLILDFEENNDPEKQCRKRGRKKKAKTVRQTEPSGSSASEQSPDSAALEEGDSRGNDKHVAQENQLDSSSEGNSDTAEVNGGTGQNQSSASVSSANESLSELVYTESSEDNEPVKELDLTCNERMPPEDDEQPPSKIRRTVESKKN